MCRHLLGLLMLLLEGLKPPRTAAALWRCVCMPAPLMHRINWIFPIANDFNLFLLFLKGPTQNRVGSWCFLPFSSALYVMLITHTHTWNSPSAWGWPTGLLHFHGCSFAQLRPFALLKERCPHHLAVQLSCTHHTIPWQVVPSPAFSWEPFLGFLSCSMEQASLSKSAAPQRPSHGSACSLVDPTLKTTLSHALDSLPFIYFLFKLPVFSSCVQLLLW